jgi:hypothetical protein
MDKKQKRMPPGSCEENEHKVVIGNLILLEDFCCKMRING